MTRGPSRRAHADLDLIGLLSAILADNPRIDDAACNGRWSLFEPVRDNEHRHSVLERHERAKAICAHCPALDTCRRFAADEPPDGSVLAGRSTAVFPGRPSEAA